MASHTHQANLARELVAMSKQHGAAAVCKQLAESVKAGREGKTGCIALEDLSFRHLAYAAGGDEFYMEFDPSGEGHAIGRILTEAAGAVSLAAFSKITGQVLISGIMAGYDSQEFFASKLIPTRPSALEYERWAGVTGLGDLSEVVDEGQPFPEVGFSDDYIETPVTKKRGEIVSLTKEAVFFDKTSQVVGNAMKLGYSLALNKEKRVLDGIIGQSPTLDRYKWRGTSYATYQASTPWINVKTSNALVDWTNIDASEQIFAGMNDPNTGEPIEVGGETLIVMPAKKATANRITHATEVQFGDGASNTVRTIGPTPLGKSYTVYTSNLLYRRVVAASGDSSWWFQGDPAKAFAYMENWPITVVQAPPQSIQEFERDIVMRVKASERGSMAVIDPRYMVKNSTS